MSQQQQQYNPISVPRLRKAHTFDDMRTLVMEIHAYLATKQNQDIGYLNQLTNNFNNSAQGYGELILAADTVAPTTSIHEITQTGVIRTIKFAPGQQGGLDLIAIAPFSLVTGGNIGAALTVPIGNTAHLVFNPNTNIWYPIAAASSSSSGSSDAEYVVLALNASLTQERVLTKGDGIGIADGGPNGPVTVSNTGVRSVTAGSGITVSDSTGDVTIAASPAPPNLALSVSNVAFADSPVAVAQDTTVWTYYRGDATAGAIVFDLPHAVGSGMVVGFAKLDGTTNALTPTAFAGDNINDLGTYTLDKQRSVIWLADVAAGSWDVILYTPLS